LMRALGHVLGLVALVFSAAILAAMGAPVLADTAVSPFDSQHHFVVVTFSNTPYRPVARAGTTGRRYTGDNSYGVAQTAHQQAQRVATAYSLKQVASWPIRQLAVHCVVYEIPDSRPVAEVLAALTQDPRITLAQPLQEFHTLTGGRTGTAFAGAPAGDESNAGSHYNDPLYGLQTNLAALGIPAAHQRTQGEGVRVALIDTGVDTRHPDLHGRITGTRSFIAPTGLGATSYRHGTAMAGLIAAVANNHVGIVGIAPLARIEVFEACWQLRPDADEAACNTFTLAQALGAALDAGIPLVNLSIAGPADPLLSALVRSGVKRGVIFIGSTASEADTFPTNIEGVIGVGSSESEHAKATLSAPATHVLTLRPEGQYDFESGTSVAAAEITGVVALLLSADNHLTTDGIVSLLKGPSVSRVSTVVGPASPTSINVGAALAKLDADKAGSRLARLPNTGPNTGPVNAPDIGPQH
jgi:subtilisin family serine protease